VCTPHACSSKLCSVFSVFTQVPREAVIVGEAKARALVIPTAGTCGTPSRHQLLCLRSLFLSSPAVKSAQATLLIQDNKDDHVIISQLKQMLPLEDTSALQQNETSPAQGLTLFSPNVSQNVSVNSSTDLNNSNRTQSRSLQSTHDVQAANTLQDNRQHGGHRRGLTVLLIIRTKSRRMANAHEILKALQEASIGSNWSESVQSYGNVTDDSNASAAMFSSDLLHNDVSLDKKTNESDLPGKNKVEFVSRVREVFKSAEVSLHPRNYGSTVQNSTTVREANFSLARKLTSLSAAPEKLSLRQKMHQKSISSMSNVKAPQRFIPRESTGAHPPFHLRIFNDSALPTTQVRKFICE
jgi:hypothetical protein